ncbi:MAG TPA: SulP family inorganic anion transporter [Chthoniobacterales bacterium]|nr:SulP family inorganic anion transporter [Chthoniobacterales bacterium]
MSADAQALSSRVIRGDIFGGLAAGVVALPLALAFGVASGLGPVAGLYGAIAAGIIAAVFGGTPVQITGPTGPMTLVVATVVAANTIPSGAVNLPAVVGIIVVAGLLQVAFGLFRIGAYIRYVPYPVISGFMSGIGVIIILQQLFPMLGATAPSSNPLNILGQLHLLGANINWAAVALSGATIAIVFLLPRFTKAVPASLVALVVLTALASLLKLDVPMIGAIPSGLPSLVMPSVDFQRLVPLMAAALQLGLLGTVDSLLTSLVADNLTRTQHNSNRELIGQGLGNIAAGLIGGIPGAGATMRTVVNVEAGGKTRLSGVVHGLFLAAVLLGLSGLVQYVPLSVLAGLLVAVGIGIIDYRGFSHVLKVPRSDAFLMLFVLILTVFTGLIIAVAVGLIVASFVFMKKVSDTAARQTTLTPAIDEPWADELTIPEAVRHQVVIKHVDGPLFFGFASQFLDIARQAAAQSRLLILRMDRVSYMDQTGVYALKDALNGFIAAGVRVLVVGIPVTHRDLLEKLQVIPAVVPESDVFDDFDALKKALPRSIAEIPLKTNEAAPGTPRLQEDGRARESRE